MRVFFGQRHHQKEARTIKKYTHIHLMHYTFIMKTLSRKEKKWENAYWNIKRVSVCKKRKKNINKIRETSISNVVFIFLSSWNECRNFDLRRVNKLYVKKKELYYVVIALFIPRSSLNLANCIYPRIIRASKFFFGSQDTKKKKK